MLKKSNAFKFLIGTFVFALALVVTTAVSASYDFGSTTLRVGSKGDYVKTLQTLVGASPVDGSFGPMTKAKVMAWQASNGLTADGVFGPLSMAKANLGLGGTTGTFPAGCTSASGFSTTTGQPCGVVTPTPGCPAGALFNSMTGASCTGTPVVVTGGAGDVQDVDVLSTYSGEDVSEGTKDAKIMAFEVEADNGSDLSIQNIKLAFQHNTTDNGSDRLNKYITGVSVWSGSTKIGSANVDEFSESGDIYTRSIPLTGAIVKSDGKATFVVAVDAASSIDTGDQNENWIVGLESIRFVDGTGVVTTDSSTGDLGNGTTANATAANDDHEVDFSFEELSTSGDLEIKLTEATTSPDARTIEVDSTSDTGNVTLLGFNLKATASKMTVDQLTFDVTPTGANANEIVKEYRLMMGNTEVDSMAATSIATTVTGQIVFTDLEDDIMLAEGSTTAFTLVADINDLEGAFGNGDSIVASLTSTNFNSSNSVIEDENGDSVVNGDRTGSVTGESQTFYENGISVALDSVDADSFTVDAVNNDRAELVIKFKATAFGADAYIPSLVTVTSAGTGAAGTAPTAAQGTGIHLQSSDAQLTTAKGSPIMTSTAEETAYTPTVTDATDNSYSSLFKIVEGATETFTVKVTVSNAVATAGDLDDAQVRAILTGISFSSGTNVIVTAGVSVFTSDLQDTYKTAYATIAD